MGAIIYHTLKVAQALQLTAKFSVLSRLARVADNSDNISPICGVSLLFSSLISVSEKVFSVLILLLLDSSDVTCYDLESFGNSLISRRENIKIKISYLATGMF